MARIVFDRVVYIDIKTIKTVVCSRCCMPVAQFDGSYFSGVGVGMAIARHIDHPRNELTTDIGHDLETYDHRKNRMTDGVFLKEDYVM
jgi:hypothetical protein